MDLGLKGKVALVAAASKGLGQASAIELAREGARVAVFARSDAIKETGALIEAVGGPKPLVMQGDVADPDKVERIVGTTLEHFGRIDVLVLNAGGPPSGNFFDVSVKDWERAVQLTLMSAVYLCRAVLPHMVERGDGSIVAIESVSVKQPIDNLILSNSIRMAVIGMLKSLANEFGPRGIRINSLNPTFTWTGRVEQLLTARAEKNGTSIESELEKVRAGIPLQRVGTAEEFGRTLAWLASPAAAFVHGHALMFDGGATKSAL